MKIYFCLFNLDLLLTYLLFISCLLNLKFRLEAK